MMLTEKTAIRSLLAAALALLAPTAGRTAAGFDDLTKLASFDGANGEGPGSGVIFDSAGNLYGTTAGGGLANTGEVYKLSPRGVLTILHRFAGPDGANPFAGLAIDAQGNLFGTTAGGGDNSDGTVFKIAADGTFSSLHSFSGNQPHVYYGVTLDSQGNLFGTTAGAGLNGFGTVFKISSAGVFSTLHNFTGAADGAYPATGLTISPQGNFYGSTQSGGASGGGTVFQITPAGVLTTLYAFPSSTGVGYSGAGALAIDASGNIYGVTNGINPVTDSYGTTKGTVFKLSPAGALTTLLSVHGFYFTVPLDPSELIYVGEFVTSGVTVDAAGNVYGTSYTSVLGETIVGTIFKISPTGVASRFELPSSLPNGGLVLDDQGNLYGTLENSQASPYGEIFKFRFGP